MPAIRQSSPIILKEVLESAGWKVYTESRTNWSLVNSSGVSIELPKKGPFVSFQVMEAALAAAEMAPGDYFRHLDEVQTSRKQRGLTIDGLENRPRVN